MRRRASKVPKLEGRASQLLNCNKKEREGVKSSCPPSDDLLRSLWKIAISGRASAMAEHHIRSSREFD